MDFSSLTESISLGTVTTAIIAMGALMIVPNVARWGVRKIAGFFR